jgi:hypothetical protein
MPIKITQNVSEFTSKESVSEEKALAVVMVKRRMGLLIKEAIFVTGIWLMVQKALNTE